MKKNLLLNKKLKLILIEVKSSIYLLLRVLTSMLENLMDNRLHCTLLPSMDTLLFASNYPLFYIHECGQKNLWQGLRAVVGKTGKTLVLP